MNERKVRALLADDSAVTRMFLTHLLESHPRIVVIGAVANGQAAVDFVQHDQPDVVLMDIHMPLLDGFEATRRIMETNPVPIVICSATSNLKDIVIGFRAMEAGAIACVEKPLGREHHQFEAKAAHLLETVMLMSEIKVVRRNCRGRPLIVADPVAAPSRSSPGVERIVGIGASTGGPPVLQTIFAALPKDFPMPMLVVQHMAHGFLAGMVEWLNHCSSLQIQMAAHGTVPLPGHVYVAPDDFQMGLGAEGRIVLTRDALEDHLRPAVSYLFRSLAESCGPRATGVLLTGMGRDGAAELKSMKDRGAVTIVQDRESSIVYGMPGAAMALDAAVHVLPADRIAARLVTLAALQPTLPSK